MNPQGNQTYAPVHTQEALKLEADGYAHLYRIRMFPPGASEVIVTIKPEKTVTWQGSTWEEWPVNLTDYRRESSGEVSRPKMTLANPEGIFSTYAHKKWLDNAEVKRYRVLGQHLTANVNSYLLNTWRVGKVATLNPTMIVLELRSVLDGQSFLLPGRAFYPPEFPTVSV